MPDGDRRSRTDCRPGGSKVIETGSPCVAMARHFLPKMGKGQLFAPEACIAGSDGRPLRFGFYCVPRAGSTESMYSAVCSRPDRMVRSSPRRRILHSITMRCSPSLARPCEQDVRASPAQAVLPHDPAASVGDALQKRLEQQLRPGLLAVEALQPVLNEANRTLPIGIKSGSRISATFVTPCMPDAA